MYLFDSRWQISLAITLLIELAVVAVWQLRSSKQHANSTGWVVTLVLGVNLLTHPLAWLVSSYNVSVVWIEIAVVVVEAGVLAMIPEFHWRKAGFLSLTMNLASFVLGLLVLAFAWPT